MNKVQLIGRLTKDPELKYTTGDNPIGICRFTLAINRIKDKEGKTESDFINCKAFGARADAISKFVFKGDRLGISGSWQTGSYKKEDGTTIYTNECLVESIDFLTNKSESTPANNDSDDNYVADDNDLPF